MRSSLHRHCNDETETYLEEPFHSHRGSSIRENAFQCDDLQCSRICISISLLALDSTKVLPHLARENMEVGDSAQIKQHALAAARFPGPFDLHHAGVQLALRSFAHDASDDRHLGG